MRIFLRSGAARREVGRENRVRRACGVGFAVQHHPSAKLPGFAPRDERLPPLAQGVAAVYTPKDFELTRIMRDMADLALAHRG